MNEQVLQGKWKEFRGIVKERWGRLTDDDLDRISGRREELVGRVQAAYGKSREEAEKEVDSFFDTVAA